MVAGAGGRGATETPAVPLSASVLLAGVAFAGMGPTRTIDHVRPQPPIPERLAADVPPRPLGTPATVFVNFDGIELDECNPSDSHEDCHWYNYGVEFPPFSGSLQTRVSILQVMRRVSADYGIRITARRPPDDEDYVMVVVGGTEEEYGQLGSAPAGDCEDQRPNEIAFAHLDGDSVDWVTGGATTAIHEAAHTWGLDHIDVEHAVMYPTTDGQPAAFHDGCAGVVGDIELTPAPSSCPELAEQMCGTPGQQDSAEMLRYLFGPPYVDTVAPVIELLEPEDGQYFQAPAAFDVVLAIDDDLDPQRYQRLVWLEGEPRPETGTPVFDPSFGVEGLPVGQYTVHVVVFDEAGNEGELAFDIEVGVEPPPPPEMDDGEGEGCACGMARAGTRPRPAPIGLLAFGVMVLFHRRPRR
jgi:hypothetical protein